MPKPKDDGKTYYEMPKTTKGDGMERMAERWLFGDGRYPNQLKSLTRILRKVAKEAARKQTAQMLDIASDGLNEVLIHLDGSTCDCGEELGDIDAANSAREALYKLRKIKNRRSA